MTLRRSLIAHDDTRADIEKDFNLWESFRGSMDDIDHKTDTEVILKSNGDTSIHQEEEQPASEQPHRLQHPFEDPDRAKWEQRLQREEIYSKRYRPSAAEEQELQDLERVLGIRQQPSSARRLLSFGRSNSKVVSEEDRARWYAVARPEAAASQSHSETGSLLADGAVMRPG